MSQIKFGYLPLSFITSDEEIRRQVKNTIICRYVFDKFKNPQKLLKFLKSTQYGFTASAQNTGKNKLLRISDIKNGVVDWQTVPYCDCEREEDYLLQVNDILIARTGGTTGKSFIVKEIIGKPVFASYLISLRVNEKLNPDYLYLFLNSYAYWSQIAQMKKGSAQPNVNAERLKELIIPYCNLKIQEKLVALANDSCVDDEFHSLFETINKTLEKVDLANELKTEYDEENLLISKLRQAILQEAVQGKLVPQDPADEPATELLKRIKAEKLQLMQEKKIKKEEPLPPISPDEVPYGLPEGWVWVRLGDISNQITDGTHHTPKYVNQGIPFLSVKDITNGFIDFSNTKFISEKEHNELIKRCKPEYEDILLTKVGTTGIAKVIDIQREFSIFVSLALIKFYKTEIFPKFLEYLLNSPFVKCQSEKYTMGIGNKNLVLKYIKNFLIPLPPLNEQKRIVAKVDELMKLCDELEEQIRQSKEESERLMQAVLREAFEGKDVEESNNDIYNEKYG